MSTQAFDPVKFKAITRQQWDEVAQAWHHWMPVLRAWMAPATELMLQLAQVDTGKRVLDVAAGDGDQTLTAAQRVGATGHVLAIDLAPNLVAIIEENARKTGLNNVEARVMDGENLELPDASFDAAISRLGVMYFPDPVKGLNEMARVLKPNGRAAVLVFSTPDKNPFFSIAVSTVRRRAQLPPPQPGMPGPFSLGAPGILAETFRKAGYRDIEAQTVSVPLRMKSAVECLRFEQESFGALHAMMAGMSEDAKRDTWSEIEEGLRAYDSEHGFESPSEVIIGVGVK